MAWERGYYYSVHKISGRVVREYVGAGRDAELVAQLDALERDRREQERADLRALKAEWEALDARVQELIEASDLLARAALVAAGYRQHKRGEWRRTRVPRPTRP
jgi:hypothetical protein